MFPVSRESQVVDMDHLFMDQQSFDNEAIFDRRRKTGLFEMSSHGMRTKKIRDSNNSRNSNRLSNRPSNQGRNSRREPDENGR